MVVVAEEDDAAWGEGEAAARCQAHARSSWTGDRPRSPPASRLLAAAGDLAAGRMDNGHAPERAGGGEGDAAAAEAAGGAVDSASALEDRALAHDVDAQNPGAAAAALGQYDGPASVALTSAAVRDVVEDMMDNVRVRYAVAARPAAAAAGLDADTDDADADAGVEADEAAATDLGGELGREPGGEREDAVVKLRVIRVTRVGRKMVLTKTGVDAWSREAAP